MLTRTYVAAGVAALLASAWAGSAYTGSRKDAQIARMERDRAQAVAAIADAASVRLYEAQQRADVLTARLLAERRAARELQEKLDDALKHATDGRVCLRDAALRLLDQSPGIRVAGLPPAPGGIAGADAERVATDTDLAAWARRAGGEYAECVRRLDALIDYEQPQ